MRHRILFGCGVLHLFKNCVSLTLEILDLPIFLTKLCFGLLKVSLVLSSSKAELPTQCLDLSPLLILQPCDLLTKLEAVQIEQSLLHLECLRTLLLDLFD